MQVSFVRLVPLNYKSMPHFAFLGATWGLTNVRGVLKNFYLFGIVIL